MRVGVISEGPADFAVVRNIIHGAIDLDASDVDSIRPDLQSDETSLHRPDDRSFSNWEIVKQECEQLTSIRNYLDNPLVEARLVVIQIDTAECELAGVARPDRNADTYVSDCASTVAAAISEWTQHTYPKQLVEAPAVEGTDAWLLPLYQSGSQEREDTGLLPRPKERLERALDRTNELSDRDRKRLRGMGAVLRRAVEAAAKAKGPCRSDGEQRQFEEVRGHPVCRCAARRSLKDRDDCVRGRPPRSSTRQRVHTARSAQHAWTLVGSTRGGGCELELRLARPTCWSPQVQPRITQQDSGARCA